MKTSRLTSHRGARPSLGAALAVLVTLALGAFPATTGVAAAAGKGSVTFAAYGGTGEAAEAAAWLNPFAKKTGIKVLQDSPVTWAKVQQMVQAHDVTWDVVEGGTNEGVTNNPDLVDINCKIVDCAIFKGKQWPAYKQAVPLFDFDYVLAYNTKDFKGKQAPKSWADFFNPAIKGQRDVMPTSGGWEGLLEGAELAAGVPRNKLYPINFKTAFAEFDKIKSQINVMQTDDQCVSDVASGEAIMGTCYNGRVALAEEAGQPIAIAWGQQIQFVDYLFIPKGTPHLLNAQKLIAYIVKHEGVIGNHIAYSGINPAGLNPHSKWTKYLPSQNVLKGALAPIVPNQGYWNNQKHVNAAIQQVTEWATA